MLGSTYGNKQTEYHSYLSGQKNRLRKGGTKGPPLRAAKVTWALVMKVWEQQGFCCYISGMPGVPCRAGGRNNPVCLTVEVQADGTVRLVHVVLARMRIYYQSKTFISALNKHSVRPTPYVLHKPFAATVSFQDGVISDTLTAPIRELMGLTTLGRNYQSDGLQGDLVRAAVGQESTQVLPGAGGAERNPNEQLVHASHVSGLAPILPATAWGYGRLLDLLVKRRLGPDGCPLTSPATLRCFRSSSRPRDNKAKVRLRSH